MSWSFRKVGTIKEALKASVQAESACPQPIRDEICRRIDYSHNDPAKGQAIYVASHGHLESGDRPYNGVDEIKIRVMLVPLIDTPLPA